MSDDSYFLRETVCDISAAMIGIHKDRWTFIKEDEATLDKATQVMKGNRFDVLPIESSESDANILEYFHTRHWNDYSSIARESLTNSDIIPMQTPARDLIKGLAGEDRLFYFLSNEDRVAGLVSVANLNSHLVKIYLFNLLSELEIRLGKLLSANFTEDRLRQLTYGEEEKEKEVRNHLNEAEEKGLDVSIIEFLYLSQILDTIRREKLYAQLGYSSGREFSSLNSLVPLRDHVAHPTHTLINKPKSVDWLWKKVDSIEDALSRLRMHQGAL